MTFISLKEVIDDILLLVRNNNISESEDLSRTQIANWIKSYKAALIKQRLDKQKEDALNDEDQEDTIDNIYIREKGPFELEDVPSYTNKPTFTKVTKEEIKNVFNDAESSILAIHDADGCDIQYMNHERRHYNYFRKYTFGEMTGYYNNGHIYIEGTQDKNRLKYIWIYGIFETTADEDALGDDADEGDIMIPSWMVPPIKKNILDNELAFMTKQPSDDSNNATLSSVKPHGPQDAEE